MNRLIIFLFFFCMSSHAFSQEPQVLKGIYLGKNIYVQNPYAPSGEGFCATKVLVNGKPTSDTLEDSAFEIKLDLLGLNIGDSLVVQVFHKPDCRVRVLNPESFRKEAFDFVSVKIDTGGTLSWKTKHEDDKFLFIIEQYRWNKWTKVGEAEGKGGDGENEYSCKVVPHSGENQFRVKRMTLKYPNISKPAKWNTKIPKPNPEFKRAEGKVLFNTESLYELYNRHGDVLKKGTATWFDCSTLKAGLYYLNYDNHTIELYITGKGEIYTYHEY